MIETDKNMSNYLSAYDITNGTIVSVQVKDRTLRGEFIGVQLAIENSKNPAEDKIVLDKPLELPNGKCHEEPITIALNEIRQSKESYIYIKHKHLQLGLTYFI